MKTILKMTTVAQNMKDNQSDESLYLLYGTNLKIKSIESIDGNFNDDVIIRTHSIVVNRGIISENWVELYFMIEYDMNHNEAIECLLADGYTEYEGISKLDFLRIKSIDRKVYKFIMTEAESKIEAIQRSLDFEKYDDVERIRNVYGKKVGKYENMVSDVKRYQHSIEFDKDEFYRNKEKLEKYSILLDKL